MQGFGGLSIWRAIIIGAGFAMIALIYIPIVWLGVMSFTPRPLSGIPDAFTLQWYKELVDYTDWAEPLELSAALATGVAVFCMLVATAVGRAIPRMTRQNGILLLALLPLFVPGLTMGAALFLFFRSYLELRLGVWSVFLGHVVWALPFSLLLVVVIAARFDHRLLEAAADLGASPRQAFWHIEAPILRPGIIGAGLFGFLLSFNELLRTLFLRGFSTTLPIYQWAQSATHQTQIATTFSLATIILAAAFIIIFVFFWFVFVRLQKQ